MTTDGVPLYVVGVDFKVECVKGKSLDEAEDGLAEEGVNTKGSAVLEQQRDDRVAEYEGDEGARSLDLVFDVCAGEEVEHAV